VDKLDETKIDRDDHDYDDRSDGEESLNADAKPKSHVKYPRKPTLQERINDRHEEIKRELDEKRSDEVDANYDEYLERIAQEEEEERLAEEEERRKAEEEVAVLEQEQRDAEKARADAEAKSQENRS
jgi:hypothetical protein